MLLVHHVEHQAGAEARRQHRRHEGACAGADEDIKIVDSAVHEQVVNGPQRANFIDSAGQAAAGQDERRLPSGWSHA